MTRLVFAILGTAAVVAFAMTNTHHVELSFIFGSPVHVRMIFLLLTAFAAGMVSTFFIVQVNSVRRSRSRRRAARVEAVDETEGAEVKDLAEL